jgi:hypothetical protein
MIEHLRLISQATAKDRQALVIVDRAGWHMTKAIRWVIVVIKVMIWRID